MMGVFFSADMSGRGSYQCTSQAPCGHHGKPTHPAKQISWSQVFGNRPREMSQICESLANWSGGSSFSLYLNTSFVFLLHPVDPLYPVNLGLELVVWGFDPLVLAACKLETEATPGPPNQQSKPPSSGHLSASDHQRSTPIKM